MYSCSSSVGGNSVRDGNNVRSDSMGGGNMGGGNMGGGNMGGGNMGGGNMGGGNSVRDGRRTLVLVGFQLWDLR